MLTGEPVPVTKRVGDTVIGATLNTSGSLVMKATKVGSGTMLSQIVQMVANAQRSKAPMQRMADKVAGYFVVTVIGIALLTRSEEHTSELKSLMRISYAVFCLKNKILNKKSID